MRGRPCKGKRYPPAEMPAGIFFPIIPLFDRRQVKPTDAAMVDTGCSVLRSRVEARSILSAFKYSLGVCP